MVVDVHQARSPLRATFQHLPRVGVATEAYLWSEGVLDWEDLADLPHFPGISSPHLARIKDELRHSEVALRTGNADYFARTLPPREHWRLYHDFRARTAFLDIETTGFSPTYGIVTCVTVHGGGNTRTLVQGDDLEELGSVLQTFALLVTFNGSQFDVPFLTAHFPEIRFPPAHADLRWIFQRQGLTGGLKAIEHRLRLGNRSGVEGVDGWEAVRLWHQHCRGVKGALERLVAYNRADTVNLETLMEHAVREMWRQFPSR
ncbi:MAG: ribonuclease H-like domain-containing protein [Nitrososphaerota archaeon]|nr:ribonuclease H-like domain-containing protein [Nitrososphaerota archaeon]